ncbi:MAG: FecR domain-containing protein [Candidatus Pseudobacter hemicellulosilyticus]|uniref:FecR domain-containing protein n=1 Tax=Candidatus Pseudobacter hemicellulosilyticus TaxID=3121375 RepID=A0AAJ5WVE4_9BACT|nr:MAG: FecR domain-containing protein [Pseudobacter sp.]
MPFSETYIAHLVIKQLSGELTQAEALALQEWCAASEDNARLYTEWMQRDRLPARLREFEEAAAQAALVEAPLVASGEPAMQSRRFLLGRPWLHYAAAFLILAVGAVLLWAVAGRTDKTPVVADRTPPAEITPAGFKATLTLADGSVIPLDSAADGTIAQQGNMNVVNLPDGEIRYEGTATSNNTVMMNTVSTPKGGQYRVVLPDGTKVWLNAASSVSYPASFTGNTRTIKMTGEAYFEIAPDKARPFFVDINGESNVEVLGTAFNVNAYKDHDAIKTTLLSGRIKAGGAAAVVLSPGQQAVQETGAATGIQVVDEVDLGQVLAWKNGIFDLTGASFKTLMREVERWYDVDVVYEGAVPDIRLKGKMDRAVKLSGVIRFLTDYGVRVQLEGRTLTIQGK